MKNQIIIRTSGNRMLPNGLAFNISKYILGLLKNLFRNLYNSIITNTEIIMISTVTNISDIILII